MASSILTPNPTTALQNAAAAPTLIRASKTFTGAANLGAVGVNELFTTTGAVQIDSFFWRCTTDLEDAVDGATFTIGTAGNAAELFNSTSEPIDLDNINAGVVGYSSDAITTGLGLSPNAPLIVVQNIIMTVGTQAITGGVLAFYIQYRPLSADGALAIGAGMVSI